MSASFSRIDAIVSADFRIRFRRVAERYIDIFQPGDRRTGREREPAKRDVGLGMSVREGDKQLWSVEQRWRANKTDLDLASGRARQRLGRLQGVGAGS